MELPLVSRVIECVRSLFREAPDRFLAHAKGVIHVGANIGQERDLYRRHGLPVVWIEPIPEVFQALKVHLRECPSQVALEYLVTDRDGAEYTFHISSNAGKSSSVLDLKLHKEIWPSVTYSRAIPLKGMTLSSMVRKEQIDMRLYDTLVMDTQGAELLVLKGAVSLLPAFRYIKTEVPDFEAYEGCCRLRDIEAFVREHGFVELSRHAFAGKATVGTYYDVVYERQR